MLTENLATHWLYTSDSNVTYKKNDTILDDLVPLLVTLSPRLLEI